MKIAQRQTAIDRFHSVDVQRLSASQNSRVMAVVQPGRDYSLSELMRLVPGIDKSSMSRTVNGLRAVNLLEAVPVDLQRKCTVTGVTARPSRLPVNQKELFA